MSEELFPLSGGGTRVQSLVARAEGTDLERFERVLPILKEGVSAATRELRTALDEVGRERAAAAGNEPGVPRSEARHLSSPVTRGDADEQASRT